MPSNKNTHFRMRPSGYDHTNRLRLYKTATRIVRASLIELVAFGARGSGWYYVPMVVCLFEMIEAASLAAEPEGAIPAHTRERAEINAAGLQEGSCGAEGGGRRVGGVGKGLEVHRPSARPPSPSPTRCRGGVATSSQLWDTEGV